MTKTVNGKTYELVRENYKGTDLPCLNCYDCVAIDNITLGFALGNECIDKGIWKEVKK